MKKITKHLVAFALALIVAVASIAPVTAQAKVTDYTNELNVYLNGKNSQGYGYINVYLEKSDTIKKSTVKVTDKKVAKLYRLDKYTSTSKYEYFEEGRKGGSSDSYRYEIGLDLLKAGTTTVSWKVGKKTYSTKVKVNAYENPLKTAKIFGTNYAGKLKNQNSYRLKNSKDKKNQSFTFEANKNWKIASIYIAKYEKKSENWYSSTYFQRWDYSSPKSKVSNLSVGTFDKNKYYAVEVDMVNTQTGGSMWCRFYINDPWQ